MTPDLDGDFAVLARGLRDVTVRVADERARGAGSGIVWAADGRIVTNAHVVRGDRARVTWEDGRSLRATVVRRDDARDLALLRVEPLPPARAVAPVRSAGTLRVGELAVAVGNPLGYVGAFTTGLVQRCNARWVTSSVRLAPGNSGGPLADSAGRVVGINSMVAGNLSLAIPSDAVTAFVDAALAPRLGVAVAPAVASLGRRRAQALVVTAVEAGSVAERSGLAIGDAILAVEGTSVGALDDIARALGVARALEILRGGRRTTISLERDGTTRAA